MEILFKANYGASFSTCSNSDHLRRADERLIEIFNIYANTNDLYRQKSSEAIDIVKKVQSCCLKILEAWLTESNDIFKEPSTLDHYKTAVTLHYSWQIVREHEMADHVATLLA